MHYRRSARIILLVLAMVISAAGHMEAQAQSMLSRPASDEHPDVTPFLAENTAAMERMMTGMHGAPTGDIDADFAAMMIPHHQGAIDMAVTFLRYGKNEQLRRLAQEIIVEQQQEIAAMKLALGQPVPASAPAPTQAEAATPFAHAATHDHSAMSHDAMSMAPANE